MLRCSMVVLHCSVGALGVATARADDGGERVAVEVRDGGGGPDPRSRFEAALEQITHDEARAADELVALADAQPESDYAAEALSEAAQLLEDRLGHPDRARELYARIVARYPDSRPFLRARGRLAFLDENLRTGAAPLGEYQRILGGFAGRPPAESRRLMAQLVEQHPDFALADRALLWLATLDARDGRLVEAEARFAEVERRFPERESAALARRGRADARLVSGHPWEARAMYRELLGEEGRWPAVAVAARAGEEAAARAIRREEAFWGCVAWVVGYVVVLVRVGRVGNGKGTSRSTSALVRGDGADGARRSPRLGAELGYYLPVAALFVVAAATESRPIALATAAMAVGGALIVWACGGAVERLVARGRLGRATMLGLGVATVIAVLALGFAALHKTQLLDFVVETVRSGPDR